MIERFVRMTYTGFLTENEIVAVIGGTDMWIEGDDLVQRLIAFSQYRDEARTALIAELSQPEVEEDPTSVVDVIA